MESEQRPLISKEEARASLAEIDRIVLHTRRTISRGISSPIIIMWGVIWMIGFTGVQFFPAAANWLWTVLDIIGAAASIFFGIWSRYSPIKSANHSRIGFSWMILFGFAFLWVSLMAPWDFIHAEQWVKYGPVVARKMAAFWSTVPMFGYILMGLWLDRFLIWLGALVTVATLVGYYFIADYFFLWMAVVGGGALVAGGIFIRKCWR